MIWFGILNENMVGIARQLQKTNNGNYRQYIPGIDCLTIIKADRSACHEIREQKQPLQILTKPGKSPATLRRLSSTVRFRKLLGWIK